MKLGPWLTRYRPLVALIVAVAAIVLVPGVDDNDGGRSGIVRSSTPADVAAAPGAATDLTSPAGVVDGGGVAGARGVANAGRRTAGAAGTPAAVSAATVGKDDPGIRSREALARPDCDPSTGLVKFPIRNNPWCVKPWPKGADNGGATYPGVTATEIKYVVYFASTTSDNDMNAQMIRWREYGELYNTHYEMWGRKVVFVPFKATGMDEVSLRADAVKVADLKPFIVHADTGEAFHDDLNTRKIITWTGFGISNESAQKVAPYRWSVAPDDRITFSLLGEYVGKRLANRPAKWAGDPAMTVRPRSLALIYPAAFNKAYFDAEMAKYNATLTDSIPYEAELTEYQERARVIVARLKDKGVTSVILGSDLLFNVFFTREATSQQYNPEWVITGITYNDVAVLGRLNDPQQMAHLFGIGAVPPLPPISQSYWLKAYRWHYGKEPASTSGDAWSWMNPAMAGLHLAGPNLNPQTFQQGMFATPPDGGVHCSCVLYAGQSFGVRPGQPWLAYTARDDFTEKWWDGTTVGEDELGVTGPGVYQFVDGGKRWLYGTWPTSEPKAFVRAGAVPGYPTYPPGEERPTPPHQPH